MRFFCKNRGKQGGPEAPKKPADRWGSRKMHLCKARNTVRKEQKKLATPPAENSKKMFTRGWWLPEEQGDPLEDRGKSEARGAKEARAPGRCRKKASRRAHDAAQGAKNTAERAGSSGLHRARKAPRQQKSSAVTRNKGQQKVGGVKEKAARAKTDRALSHACNLLAEAQRAHARHDPARDGAQSS